MQEMRNGSSVITAHVIANLEILRKESPILAVVFLGVRSLQKHEVREFIPVDRPSRIGVDLHEKLRELRLGEIVAEVWPDPFDKFIEIQLATTILICFLWAPLSDRKTIRRMTGTSKTLLSLRSRSMWISESGSSIVSK